MKVLTLHNNVMQTHYTIVNVVDTIQHILHSNVQPIHFITVNVVDTIQHTLISNVD